MELIENLIERNKKDLITLNGILKKIDKIKSSTVADHLYSEMVQQALFLTNQNKELEKYLTYKEGEKNDTTK